jgi:hypothetical protein
MMAMEQDAFRGALGIQRPGVAMMLPGVLTFGARQADVV